MGWPEMAGEHKNPATQVCGCRRLRRPDPGASGGGWLENFTGVVVWSSSSSISGAFTVVVAGIGSHDPIGLKMGQNDPIQGFRVFFAIFSRVLGLDPHLATKTRLI